MDRLTNYLFGLTLITIFVLAANAGEQYRILLSCFASVLFCLMAFLLRWLTMDGAAAASVVGAISIGLGGLPATLLLALFFISSSLVSQEAMSVKNSLSSQNRWNTRRNGLQVWSNGFWFTVLITLTFLTDSNLFVVAATGPLATAMADTWATELGSKRFQAETYIMDDFKKVSPGTDGGISIPGSLAAIVGSLAMAAGSMYVFSLSMGAGIAIFAAGILGCFVDSYMGAKFQDMKKRIKISLLSIDFDVNVSNNVVNWSSTGIGSLVALTLNLLLI